MKGFTPCYVRLLPRDINSISPQDCVGNLFVDKNGLRSIILDEEEMLNTHFWLDALPHDIYLVSAEPVREGEWYLLPGAAAPRQRGGHLVSPLAERVILSTNSGLNLPTVLEDFLDFLVGEGEIATLRLARGTDEICQVFSPAGDLLCTVDKCLAGE